MPASSELLAVSVVVVGVVTYRHQLLSMASLQNSCACHVTIYFYSSQFVAERIFQKLPTKLSLCTESHTIFVIAICPAVAPTSVFQSTSVMSPSVHIDISHSPKRDAMLLVM